MTNVHAIFAKALAPFAPMGSEEESPFADSAEDYGYETRRQRRIDMEPDGDPYEERKLRQEESTC